MGAARMLQSSKGNASKGSNSPLLRRLVLDIFLPSTIEDKTRPSHLSSDHSRPLPTRDFFQDQNQLSSVSTNTSRRPGTSSRNARSDIDWQNKRARMHGTSQGGWYTRDWCTTRWLALTLQSKTD